MTTPAGGDVQLDAIADSVAAAASDSLHAVAVRFERMNAGSVGSVLIGVRRPWTAALSVRRQE